MRTLTLPLAGLLVSLLFAGCVSAEVGRSYSPDEKASAREQMLKCFADGVMTYDDGVSPADTVARTILPLCSGEIDAVIETQGPFRSERSKRMAYSYLREHSILDAATRMVLLNRTPD